MLKITMIILYPDALWVYFILVVAKIPDSSRQNGNPQSSEQCQDVQHAVGNAFHFQDIYS